MLSVKGFSGVESMSAHLDKAGNSLSSKGKLPQVLKPELQELPEAMALWEPCIQEVRPPSRFQTEAKKGARG